MALPVIFTVLCYIAVALAEAPCKLLNDGYKIPIVALGTGRGTAQGVPNSEVRDAVLWAIEAGYRHIDTAASYNDETEVGQGIQDAVRAQLVTREQVFVTTKLWSDKHKREQVVPALRDSLSKLGLDYVDLYLVHFPVASKADGSPADIDYLETWAGMEEARELGLARSIGVSNFNITQIERLIKHAKVQPAVNEIEIERGLIPIPKSTNKARIAQNIDLFDFELTEEEVATINAFNKNVRVIDGSWFKDFPYFPFEDVEKPIQI